MGRITLGQTARLVTTVAQHRPKRPAFKARVDIVDLTLRKKVANVVGYGETLDVIDKMRKECAWAVRNGGRYSCLEPEVVFLRYGTPHLDSTFITFLEEPIDMNQPGHVPEHAASERDRWDATDDELWVDDE